MPSQASKMEMCRMAGLRAAIGGGVRSGRMASSAAKFQSVTTSASTEILNNSNEKRASRIVVGIFMGIGFGSCQAMGFLPDAKGIFHPFASDIQSANLP